MSGKFGSGFSDSSGSSGSGFSRGSRDGESSNKKVKILILGRNNRSDKSRCSNITRSYVGCGACIFTGDAELGFIFIVDGHKVILSSSNDIAKYIAAVYCRSFATPCRYSLKPRPVGFIGLAA